MLVANALRRRKGARTWDVADFLPIDWLPVFAEKQARKHGTKPKQSAAQMQNLLFAFAAQHGAKVAKPKE